MTDANRLRSFVERVENLDKEIKELNSDKHDVYVEAKKAKFNPQAIKDAVAFRRDPTKATERSALADEYLALLGSGLPTNNAPPPRAARLRAVPDEPSRVRTREPISDPVTCPPVRLQTDGAAVSNSPAPPSDTAATISDESAAELLDPIALIADHLEPVASVSPRAEHDGGALPVPHTPLGDAPTNCDDFNDIRGTPFDRNRVEAV